MEKETDLAYDWALEINHIGDIVLAAMGSEPERFNGEYEAADMNIANAKLVAPVLWAVSRSQGKFTKLTVEMWEDISLYVMGELGLLSEYTYDEV